MLRPEPSNEEARLRRFQITRRATLGLAGSVLAVAPALRRGLAASGASPISIVIHDSPWLPSFRTIVELYEKESGNKIDLDVNPFAGSLEKQRNSVRSERGSYDLLIMNSGWFVEMYAGGFLDAVTDVDPGFKLDPQVYTLGDTIYYDAASRTMTPAGKLMSFPISPVAPILFYRGDLYKEKGLQVPATFAELESNAKALHNPPRIYGIVQRGARGPNSVSYDFYPYLFGYGGAVFKDQAAADYTVVLDSAPGRAALDYYIGLAKTAGHPKTAALEQAEVMQNMVTGKAGHIIAGAAAVAPMDDPTQSIVVNKVDYAPVPHLPGLPTRSALGHWLGGISHNVPDDRKRAVVTFLTWFQTKGAQMAFLKAGGVPVSGAVYNDPIADDPAYRWMKALAASLPTAVNPYAFPEAGEVISVLELRLNEAIIGSSSTTEALNRASDEIHAVMEKYKYKTGELPHLT
jgi:multiple sugar transport system substrate-binding protein